MQLDFQPSQKIREELLRYLYEKFKDIHTLKLIMHFLDTSHNTIKKEFLIENVETLCTMTEITFYGNFKFDVTTEDPCYLQKIEIFTEKEKIMEQIEIMRYLQKGVTLSFNQKSLSFTME